MDAHRMLRLLVPVCGLSLLLPGCLSAPPENEVTWGIKAATGQLTQTTPREWQAVAEVIDEALPAVDVTLSDAQAQAIVDFVQANDLDSFAEILELIERAKNDPAVVQQLEIPDSVMEFFEQIEGDGQDIIDQIIARAQP